MYVVALVAAGGLGRRFGAGVPKQLLDLGGRSVLQRSVDAFVAHPRVAEVVVALPPGLAANGPEYLASDVKPVHVVAGGPRRQDSVALAFAAAPGGADLFLIHDAARPLVDAATIDRTIDGAARWGAAIAAVRAHDTVKLAGNAADDEPPAVEDTLDRARVWLAQTPQGFTRAVLEAALARGRAGASVTDEATLAEQAGHAVRLVEGHPHNVKITTPGDLIAARAWLETGRQEGTSAMPAVRTGLGYDSHRFIEGRPLVLGGVRIPHGQGLAGHSDADAVCHAITDAVLGAAALGDIGRHFPDSDPAWKNADSLLLLARAVAIVREAGWQVSSVDTVVVLERPKIAPHVEAIRERLAGVLGLAPDAVSVKGKSNEGMGEVGRGEGIVVHAIATLVSR